jgi:hypothetical protein
MDAHSDARAEDFPSAYAIGERNARLIRADAKFFDHTKE